MAQQPLLKSSHSEAVERNKAPGLSARLSEAHQAAQIDNVQKLRELADKFGQSVLEEDTGSVGFMPLHWAAAHNSLPSMDYLLSFPGSNIDAKDTQGGTALFHAVIKNAHEALVWLVRRGADTKVTTSDGLTISHWAARTGSASAIALLANLDVDVEAPDKDGNPPLVLAVAKGKLEVVEYLVVTRGSSEEAISKARKELAPINVRYWIERCLDYKVGCNEPAPGDCSPCGPTGLGCSLILRRLCCAGPEQVQLAGRILSFFSGVLADCSAGWLYVTPTTTLPDMSHEWRQSFALAALVTTIPCWLCFIHASLAKPAVMGNMAKGVNSQHDLSKERYKNALDSAAAVTQEQCGKNRDGWWREPGPTVVHQLAVVGPPRSKFCKGTRRVVPLFDHYCAFLRAPVGVHNYWSFVGVLTLCAVTCLCVAAASMPLVLLGDHWEISLFFVLYAGTAFMMFVGMLFFNVTLACRGLTQYELHLLGQGRPPSYMIDKESGRLVKNPYSRGCAHHCCGLLCQARSIQEVV